MSSEPKHGEWWVCCLREDLDMFGGDTRRVPAEYRFVALCTHFPNEIRWLQCGGTIPDHARHILPLRRVDLMEGSAQPVMPGGRLEGRKRPIFGPFSGRV